MTQTAHRTALCRRLRAARKAFALINDDAARMDVDDILAGRSSSPGNPPAEITNELVAAVEARLLEAEAQDVRREAGSDARYIVLADDGRFVTLGRATPPSDEELAAVRARLAALGLGGWLALMAGTFYRARCPRVARLAELTPSAAGWAAAVAALRAAHKVEAGRF